MKKLVCGVLLLTSQGIAQSPEWVNLTNGEKVSAIVSVGGDLWIGTDGGLVKLDRTTESLTFYNRANANLPDNHIRCLAMDSSGNLWIGTQYSGIGKFDGRTCQVFNMKNSSLPNDQWNTAMTADPKGNVWVGSFNFIVKYDGKSWTKIETGSSISAYIAINDILFDKTGNGWIAASWGLGRMMTDALIQGYDDFKNEIYSLALDKNNVLWIGTNGKGLIKYNGANKTVFDTSNSPIPCNTIFHMKFDSKGNLWLATYEGLVKFDGTNWTVYNSSWLH